MKQDTIMKKIYLDAWNDANIIFEDMSNLCKMECL